MNACSVNCYTCGRCVWEGGRHDQGQLVDVPFEDGQEVLTAHADASCTRTDCPHTTASVAAVEAQRPDVLAQQITELRAQVAALSETH